MKPTKFTLDDLVDISSGYQFRGRVEPYAPTLFDREPKGDLVDVVQIKDVPDRRRVRFDELVRVELDRAPTPYEVTERDVLLLVRGHRPFAATMEAPKFRTIASGNFFILRLKSDSIRPAYLAWFMNQAEFQSELKGRMRGSHMPLVTKSDVASMFVLVPTLEVQKSIIALDDLHHREQTLSMQLAEKRAQLVHLVSRQAVRRFR